MAIVRSIFAVLAGVVFIVAASIGTDLALERTVMPALGSPHAPASLLALALAYRTLYGVGGGWLTAKLAPSRPMTHAMVLAAIGIAASIAGVIAEWSAGNQWYPIALVVFCVPQSWLGAKLAARR